MPRGFDVRNFERYGIRLHRLSYDEIEMLRNWRNDPSISRFMGSTQYITPEAQLAWFESVKDRDDAYYFIAYADDVPIGYSAIKNIDWDKKCGEPGGLMYIPDDMDGLLLPCAKVLATYDLYFGDMGLEYTYAHVKDINTRSLKYAAAIGYTRRPEYDEPPFLYSTLDKPAYFKRRDALVRSLKAM